MTDTFDREKTGEMEAKLSLKFPEVKQLWLVDLWVSYHCPGKLMKAFMRNADEKQVKAWLSERVIAQLRESEGEMKLQALLRTLPEMLNEQFGGSDDGYAFLQAKITKIVGPLSLKMEPELAAKLDEEDKPAKPTLH